MLPTPKPETKLLVKPQKEMLAVKPQTLFQNQNPSWLLCTKPEKEMFAGKPQHLNDDEVFLAHRKQSKNRKGDAANTKTLHEAVGCYAQSRKGDVGCRTQDLERRCWLRNPKPCQMKCARALKDRVRAAGAAGRGADRGPRDRG